MAVVLVIGSDAELLWWWLLLCAVLQLLLQGLGALGFGQFGVMAVPVHDALSPVWRSLQLGV